MNGGTTFGYDGLGRQVKRTFGTTTYDFLLAPDGTPWDEYQGTVAADAPLRFSCKGGTVKSAVTAFIRSINSSLSPSDARYLAHVKG
jgi:hypothetical protein